MTNEEKELLIKDLCPRLPYGVKVDTAYLELNSKMHHAVMELDTETLDLMMHDDECVYIPYLRPMESMTEEEKEEFKAFHCVDEWHPEFYQAMCNLPNINNMINWLDKKMFDHRGLIPMGLALPAKEGMYN